MADVIYLDHAATTPLHPEALEAMLPFLRGRFGNPSSAHRLGTDASRAVETARRRVAAVLGCSPSEVVFTSGGTESINAAIKGVAHAQRLARVGDHIVTSAVEHHAVLHACQHLERFGFEVTYVPVDSDGLVSPAAVAAAVNERTVLVSVMTANNEVGVIQPVAEIAAAVRERGKALRRRIFIHTDAVQAANALSLDVGALGVDLLSLSSHKFRGPKGAGVLYLRRGVPFLAQMDGGGQERQRRSGTENVPGIVGTAVALEIAQRERESYAATCGRLRDRLIEEVTRAIPRVTLNGHAERRLPNNASLAFEGADARLLVELLNEQGIACSAGSACAAQVVEPSHVLMAMGLPLERALGTVRFSLSAETTGAEIDRLLAVLPDAVERARREATFASAAV